MPITKIHARQIFDSRGNPTVEVDLYTDRGMYDQADCMNWNFGHICITACSVGVTDSCQMSLTVL